MDTRKRECSPWPQGHDHLVMENDISNQIKLPKEVLGKKQHRLGESERLQELGGGGSEFGMDTEEQQDFIKWKLRLAGEGGCDIEGQEGEEKPLECSVWLRNLVQEMSKQD